MSNSCCGKQVKKNDVVCFRYKSESDYDFKHGRVTNIYGFILEIDLYDSSNKSTGKTLMIKSHKCWFE